MKKIKTLFLLSALSLAAACSDDTEMTTYAGRGDEAFFGDTAYSYTVSAELEDAYSIEVLRATPAGNASVSVAVAVADAAVALADGAEIPGVGFEDQTRLRGGGKGGERRDNEEYGSFR